MTVRRLVLALSLALVAAIAAAVATPTFHVFQPNTPALASEVNENFTVVRSEIAQAVPPGTVLPYAGTGSTAPPGFLFCNGQPVVRATYPALFAAIGETYGAGDGTNTFNVPNLQARFPVGAGPGTGAAFDPSLGTTGGEDAHVLTVAELPVHSHGVDDPGHDHPPLSPNTSFYGQSDANTVGLAGGTGRLDRFAATTGSAVTGITVQNTGGGAAHNTVPPFLALRWIIKY